MTKNTSGICNSNELTAALRGFGAATETLLMRWLETLPPEHVRTLDIAVSAGAKVGLRVLIGAQERATLELLATDPAGEVFVIGTLAHEIGPLQ